MNSYSQIGQDLRVLKHLNNKKDGFFVDIGCGFPIHINNTYLMEKNFNWTGLSIDLIDCLEPETSIFPKKSWADLRPNSKRILGDALQIDYRDIFEKNNVPGIVDFLSLDLEPPDYTLQCLFRIPFDKYQFRMICFETDEYRPGGTERRDKSRSLLRSLEYNLIETIKWGGENTNQDDLWFKEINID